MSDHAGYDDTSDLPDIDLARRAIGGEQEAFGLLFGRWFDRAFDVAWHIHYDRDTAADSVADAFAAAWQQIGGLRQPDSFGGWLLRITRNQALSRLRKDRRARPVGDEDVLVSLDTREGDDPGEPLSRDEQQQLVWAASAALGDEDASLLNLHLRHQLEPAEMAEELGVQPNAAHQRLHRLRNRLGDAIGAWLLWHHGRPLCGELASSVGASSGGFDKATARSVLRHAKGCDECSERRSLQTSPEMLFSLAPLVMADPGVRDQVATTLTGMDVPVADEVVAARWNSPDDRDLPDKGDDLPEKGDGRDLPEKGDSRDDLPDKGDDLPEKTPDKTDNFLKELDTPPAEGRRAGEAAHRLSGGIRNLSGGHPVLTGLGTMAVVLAVGGLVFGGVTRLSGSGSARTETVASGEVTTTTTDPGADRLVAPAENRRGSGGLEAKEETEGPGNDEDDEDRAEPSDAGDVGDTGGEEGVGASGPAPGTPDPTPVPPSGEEPPSGPPPSGDPPTDPPPTDDPPDESPPSGPPPTVTRFAADPAGPCALRAGVNVYFGWDSSDATSATLGPAGGPAESVATAGSGQWCADRGSTWVLTVTGPGGQDSASYTVP